MDIKKLTSLIRKNEGLKLDFKQQIDLDMESGKKELAKDVSAIANSRGGRGYIIIGIEDKTKKVLGIDDINFTEEQLQQIVSSRIDPPIPVALEIISYKEKKIAVINIYDSDQKPYQVRETGAFYIRRGSTTDTMRREEIISSFEENLNLNVELCPIVNSSEKNLDIDLVDKYFHAISVPINNENRMTLMENASIIHYDKERNKYNSTLGGLLVFSRYNNVFIPHNMVRIVNKVNKHVNNVIIIKGDLLSIVDTGKEVLKNILPNKYPIEAVCEALNNAVLYRDYSIFYKEIEIIINFKSITIKSPGCLLRDSNLNINNTLKRNMWIYEKLIALDDKHRFAKSGNGFRKMKRFFKNKGKVVFINSFRENNFKVIFPGLDKFFK